MFRTFVRSFAALCLVASGAGVACSKTAKQPSPSAPKTPQTQTHAGTQSSGPPDLTDEKADPKTTVATVDGETITESDLEAFAGKDLTDAHNEYLEKAHQIKEAGLEAMIDKKLVEKQAAAQKISPDELMKREVYDKIQPPTEAEEKALYETAKAQGKELPPFDQVKDDIAKFMKDQSSQEAEHDYHEKLRAQAKVETNLGPLLLPKVDMSGVAAADGQQFGDASAPITMVEFSDFQCPFCGKAEPTVEKVLDEYKGKVKLVYADFPLPMHENAEKASEAALCAKDQGKYWEMHHLLFQNQRTLDVASLKGYAKQLSLDETKFGQCLDSGSKAAAIDKSKAVGDQLGISSTPSFFINGRPLSGAMPYEEFKALIDYELAHPNG
jgi:predicted DsbA family dithiol-disulfide isomerase